MEKGWLGSHPRVEALHTRIENGGTHFVGFHLNRAAVDFNPVTEHVELSPDFMKNPPHLVEQGPDGEKPDPFDHNLSFVAKGEKGLCLVLGCAHAGVVNILEEASRVFGTRNFAMVVGGMHLSARDDLYLEKVAGVLAGKFNVDKWLPCHCTGFRAAAPLAMRGRNVDWGYVGTRVDL